VSVVFLKFEDKGGDSTVVSLSAYLQIPSSSWL